MAGATSSVEGVFEDFLTTILQNIGGEPTRESLINLHQLISGNAASVTSNLRGFWHRYLVLMMTNEEYIEHTGYKFVPPHNPGDYPPTMVTTKE